MIFAKARDLDADFPADITHSQNRQAFCGENASTPTRKSAVVQMHYFYLIVSNGEQLDYPDQTARYGSYN